MKLPHDLKNYRSPDDSAGDWFVFCVVVAALLACLLLPGCASIADLQSHEEMHCAGFAHGASDKNATVRQPEWFRVHAPSEKPWIYVRVDNPNATCRQFSTSAASSESTIFGCAVWQPANCIIILPKE